MLEYKKQDDNIIDEKAVRNDINVIAAIKGKPLHTMVDTLINLSSLTSDDVSNLTGYEVDTVRKFRNGKTTISPKFLNRFCLALRLSVPIAQLILLENGISLLNCSDKNIRFVQALIEARYITDDLELIDLIDSL